LFKKIIFIFIFSSFFFQILFADKIKIIDNLNKTKSIKFNFTQRINNYDEKGQCIILFPGQLKCDYDDKNKKQVIIKNKKLVIIQSRYKKKYYYPISKSPFLKILSKESLKEIISLSSISTRNNIIYMKYSGANDQNITVLFDNKKYNLLGWITKDQFNNDVSFIIDIKSINVDIKKDFFKIPEFD